MIYNFNPRNTVKGDNEIFRFLEQGDNYKDLPKKIKSIAEAFLGSNITRKIRNFMQIKSFKD